LFTHQLGSVDPILDPIPTDVFINNDSVYLEVEVDLNIISPRTQLISAPYSRVANGLEVRSTFAPETLAIKTDAANNNLYVIGADGKRNVEMGGTLYGEIWLRDNTAGNVLTVDLAGDVIGAGGTLLLKKDNGSPGISLQGGVTGGGSLLSMTNDVNAVTVSIDADASSNGAVVVPGGSISSIESFDEPGLVASPAGPLGVPVPGGFGPVFAGITLVAPAAGFAVIICEAQFSVALAAPNNALPCALTENGPIMATWSWDAGDADGFSDQTQVRIITRPIPAAGPFTYTLLMSQVPFNGAVTAGLAKITVLYFPTAYGGFAFPSPQHPNEDAQVSGAFNVEAERAASIAANQARLDEELAQIRAERAEIEARLKKLEEATKQGQNAGGGDDN